MGNKIHIFLLTGGLFAFSSFFTLSAYAGFEWAAPEPKQEMRALPQAQQPGISAPAVPAPIVETRPVQNLPVLKPTAAPLVSSGVPPSQRPSQLKAFMKASESLDVKASVPLATAPVSKKLVINPYPNQPVSTPAERVLNPVPHGGVQQFDVIQGFGKDLPLVIAMSQVIPGNFTYSFSSDIDMGTRVSWNGGKPWPDVLLEMLEARSLRYNLAQRTVHIASADEQIEDFSVSPPLPVKQAVEPQKMVMIAQPASPVRDVLPVLPVIKPPMQKASVAAAEPQPMVSRVSNVVSGVSRHNDDFVYSERPLVTARVSRMSEGEFVSSDVVDPAPAIPAPPSNEELVIPDVVADMPVLPLSAPAPLLVAPMDIKENVPIPVVESAPLPVEVAPDPIPAARPVRSAPILSPQPQLSAPVPPLQRELMMVGLSIRDNLDRVRTWRAVRGDSLKTVLMDWAEDASVELYWSSEFDYPLDSSVKMKGTFEEAVQNILTGLQNARPRPSARLHPNDPGGPAVLVVETQQVIE